MTRRRVDATRDDRETDESLACAVFSRALGVRCRAGLGGEAERSDRTRQAPARAKRRRGDRGETRGERGRSETNATTGESGGERGEFLLPAHKTGHTAAAAADCLCAYSTFRNTNIAHKDPGRVCSHVCCWLPSSAVR